MTVLRTQGIEISLVPQIQPFSSFCSPLLPPPPPLYIKEYLDNTLNRPLNKTSTNQLTGFCVMETLLVELFKHQVSWSIK